MWECLTIQSPKRALTSPTYMEAKRDLVHRSNKLPCVSILKSTTMYVATASQIKWNEVAACFSLTQNQE